MNSALRTFSIDDCYEILKRNMDTSNCFIESYEFCPLDDKVGFLGDHCFLKIHYNDGEESKILKLFTKSMCSAESQKVFAIETGAFHKECDMFEKLVPKFLKNDVQIIRDCVPSCYLVCNMNYLIFEDLTSKGYRTVNQRESMSLECVKMFLDALAKFHCASLIFEEKMQEKTGQSYILSQKFPKLFKETFFSNVECSRNMIEATKKGVLAEIEFFEEGQSNVSIELFKNLACTIFDRFREIVKPSTVYRNTICHGDLWSFNMMFKFEGDKPVHCYIVDFQSYRYGPPAQDFMGFMYLSTDRQFRQKYMAEMMSYYYGKMEEILENQNLSIKKILTYEEFIESCDYYKLFCIAQTINHFQLIMVPPEAAKNLFDEPEVLRKVLFEDKGPFVIEMCKKDAAYRRRQLESVTDLKEGLIEKGLLYY